MDSQKILILFIFLILSCKEKEKVKEIELKEGIEETKKVKIVEYKGKEKVFELFADKITSKENLMKAFNLFILIYEDSIKSVYISADSGEYKIKEGDVILKSNVKLWNSEGDTLWTESLVYKYKEGIIKSDEKCKLYQKGKFIEGKGFESKRPFKKIRVFGKVEGRK